VNAEELPPAAENVKVFLKVDDENRNTDVW
jgi:hypothetical protein